MNRISEVKLHAYNVLKDMEVEARDLRDKLKELQQVKADKAQSLREQSLKRAISEDRVDVEV